MGGCSRVCSGKGRRRLGYVVLTVYGMCVIYPLTSPDPHRLPLLIFVYTCISIYKICFWVITLYLIEGFSVI